jgi:Activator of Hsp90 ATPase homolog 1-like protein
VIEPLRMSFEVGCPAEHAFDVWTNKISRWWPADHSVSGEAGLQVVLEGRPGGRIFERTVTGVEFEWGEVTVWEPPTRLTYLWHLRQDRADATEVEITFVDQGNSTTRVEIEHRGWERLGARAQGGRNANQAGWSTLLPHYHAAIPSPSG